MAILEMARQESEETQDFQGLGVQGWEMQVSTEKFREAELQDTALRQWGHVTVCVVQSHPARCQPQCAPWA